MEHPNKDVRVTLAGGTPGGKTSAVESNLGHVLVVDDEEMIRRIAVRVLASHGYSLYEAADGLEALEVVRSRSPAIDVVVSDIVMPRCNGVELFQILSTSHPDVPVILMSGYDLTRLTEIGIEPPCAILAKPFIPQVLIDEVARCIAERS